MESINSTYTHVLSCRVMQALKNKGQTLEFFIWIKKTALRGELHAQDKSYSCSQ